MDTSETNKWELRNKASEIYKCGIKDIDNAIKHSHSCELNNCESKLCFEFKKLFFILRNHGVASRVFKACLRYHAIWCLDKECRVPSCYSTKDSFEFSQTVNSYYSNHDREGS